MFFCLFIYHACPKGKVLIRLIGTHYNQPNLNGHSQQTMPYIEVKKHQNHWVLFVDESFELSLHREVENKRYSAQISFEPQGGWYL